MLAAVGLLCSTAPARATDNSKIEALRKQIDSATGLEQAHLMDKLGEILSIQEPQRALEIESRVTAAARSFNDRELEASSLHMTGVIYRALGRYDEASSFVMKSLDIRHATRNLAGQAQCLNTLGLIEIDLANYAEALDFFHRSSVIRQEIHDDLGLAYAWNNMGTVYRLTLDYSRAIQHIEKALTIKQRFNLPVSSAYSYVNLGSTYHAMGEYGKALTAFQRALDLRKDADDARGLGNTYHAIGAVHLSLGQVDRAMEEFRRAMDLRAQVNDPGGSAETLIKMGEAYRLVNKLDQAQSTLARALETAEEIENRKLITDATFALAELMRDRHDWHNAAEWYRRHLEERSRLLSEAQFRRMSELQVRLDVERQTKELDALKHEAAIQASQLTAARAWRNSLMLALASVILVALVLVNRYRTKRRLAASYRQKSEELAARTAELERVNAELERASQVKSLFLANMSHEIRTPLNGILGMTNLLLETPLEGDQRGLSNSILSSAEGLLTIVNDILDLSKIEAGKLNLESVEFDLRECAEEACSSLELRAEEKGIELGLRFDPSAPRYVVGDPFRVRQIITNLVSNAIKFTDRGYVLVDISPVSREAPDQPAKVQISVKDTGIGIAADDIARLFQKFEQVDSSTTRRYGGTGLGLAICRQIIEAMNGTIAVESTPGAGSTFRCTIPFPAGTEVPDTNPVASVAGARIILDISHPITRGILFEICKSSGLQCDIAESTGRLAAMISTANAAGNPYHLTITDNPFPNLDPITRSLPEILIVPHSCRIRPGDSAFCLRKPVYPRRLLNTIGEILRERERAKTPSESSPQPALVAEHSGMRVLVVEDNPLNQRVASGLLKRLGCSVDLAANGRVGVELAESHSYDLIFMDCQMPEMDGFEATAKIRAQQVGSRSTPIIALTASAMQGDRERCLGAGMDDYLPKPIQLAQLSAILNRWANNQPIEPANPFL